MSVQLTELEAENQYIQRIPSCLKRDIELENIMVDAAKGYYIGFVAGNETIGLANSLLVNKYETQELVTLL